MDTPDLQDVKALVDYLWISKVFIVLVLTLFLNFLKERYYLRLCQRLQQTERVWDDALVMAFHKPFTILVWVLGLGFAGDIAATHAQDQQFLHYLVIAEDTAFIVIFTWFLIRLIGLLETRLASPRFKLANLDTTSVHAISNILRISAFITGVLVGLERYGVPISGVLAFGGLSGIGVTFAAKDMIANFFGGVMIFLDRPFEQGDVIYSPDRDIEGVVEHVGWRLTRIRTPNKQPRYVPNGVFSTIAVDNQSRMFNRLIDHTIGVRYDDASKMAAMVEAIREMVVEHEEIDKNQVIISSHQPIMVTFYEFAASTLNIKIYAFTKTVDFVEYRMVQQDIFLKAIDIIHKHGAQCAFPTSTLHLPNGVAVREGG